MPLQTSKNSDRQPVRLTSKLEKNLITYALTAGAAGVAALATAQPAEARIIATNVNISIPINGGIIEFDVNQDGVPDFGLSAQMYELAGKPPLGFFSSWLRVVPAQAGNEVWAVNGHKDDCAAAVRAGLDVDAARPFKPGPLVMVEAAGSYTRGRSSHCPWHGAHPPYLGLKFMINGEVHYGWARVVNAVRSATLTGFAYETIPNKPIEAGATKETEGTITPSGVNTLMESTGVGALALGSSRLDIWKLDVWKKKEETNLKPTTS